MSEKINALSIKLLICSFALMPLLDFLESMLGNSPFDKVAAGYRLMMLMLCGVTVLSLKGWHILHAAFFSIIISVPITNYSILVITEKIELTDYVYMMTYIVKIFSLFLYFNFFLSLNDDEFIFVRNALFVAIFLYVLSFIVAPFSGVEFLKNYNNSGRFGYKGIISAGNEGSAFCLAAMFISLLFWYYSRSVITVAFIVACCLASVFTGTKAGLVSAMLVLLLYMYFSLQRKSGWLFYVPLIVISLCGVGYYIFTYLDVAELYEKTFTYFTIQFNEYADGSIISLLLSRRDDNLIFAYDNFIKDNPYYYILGGYLISQFQIELDFFDLFFSVGVIVFVYYFVNLLRVIGVSRPKNNDRNLGLIFFIFIVLLCLQSFMAGHVLYSGVAVPFFAFIFAFFVKIKNSVSGN